MRPAINWHRIVWIAVVWTIITNGDACGFIRHSPCNPHVIASCEP